MAKRNECLNLLKCAACFGVVFIHVPFPGYLGDVIKSISLFAVPLFYMIAGYYSYGCDHVKIKRRFIKICKIFVFGYVLHFAFYLLMAVSEGTTREWVFRELWLKINSAVLCILYSQIFSSAVVSDCDGRNLPVLDDRNKNRQTG